jgi:hypothetical protein
VIVDQRKRADRYPRLLIAVVTVWGLFIAYCLYRLIDDPVYLLASAAAIATLALFPAYLWADGSASGLPVLPLHLLTFLWTFAFPLVAGHPEIGNYGPDEVAFATLCISMYAIAAIVAWLSVTRRGRGTRKYYYVLPEGRGFAFLLSAIFLAGVFISVAVGQVISVDPGLFGILRASILALASIALFVLSVRMGRGDLTHVQTFLFYGAAAFYIVVQLTTIFLVGAIVSLASAVIGYTIGRARVPWILIIASILVFGFLHSGKAEMRDRYWSSESVGITFQQVPIMFAEWIAAGARELTSDDSQKFGSQPIYERVSLMHMLLLAQRSAPDYVPFLYGETYAIIPRLLVPRIVDPEKPDSHQGTGILNMQFGIQTFEDTQGTTIGWGLLNEAYANFGLAGVTVVGALLGLLFGFVGRLTADAPVMSMDNMGGVIFAAIAIQAEFTMAVFATVLFQSLVVLVLVLPFLEKRRVGEAT